MGDIVSKCTPFRQQRDRYFHLPENAHVVPSIIGVLRESALGDAQAELRQGEELLAGLAEVVHVGRHGLLHVGIRPGARAMAGPLVEDARLVERQVLGDGEDLRVVGDAICDLLARGDVASVALGVDAGGLLLVWQAEEVLARNLGLLVNVLLRACHGDLENCGKG